MATKKRPAESAEAKPSKKSGADERPSKKLKGADTALLFKFANEASAERKPVREKSTKSVLVAEETSFPRGGASVLTPLEHRQIQNEAINDVLFEQSGTKRPPREDLDIEDRGDDAAEDGAKPKKRRKSTAASRAPTEPKEEPKVRVEGLNFKRLVAGSMVLGQVTEITSKDVGLALPNNMTGYVSLTAVSPKVTAAVEKMLAGDEEDDTMADDDDEADDVDLHKLFKIGQNLRAYVLSNGSEGMGSKRHIELSVTPLLANHGLTGSDLVVGNLVQASVESVEDHGLIMDLGLESEKIKAFLSFEELGATQTRDSVQEGMVCLCRVMQSQAKGKVIRLSLDLQGDASKQKFLTTAPTINAFLPGTPIEFLVTDTSRSDIRGKIMGMLDVTADHVHSGHPADASDDLTEVHKIGSKLQGRVLFKIGGDEDQRLGVSILEHVKAFTYDAEDPERVLGLSTIVEQATVTKVDRKLGIFLDVGVPGHLAFAHISRLSDDRIEKLDDETGAFKIGSKHRARVLNYNPIDGLYSVSLEQKVLAQPFLRIQDIKIGQVVKGKVERIVINAKGIGGVLVNLAEGITGLVPEIHMADTQLQHPEKRFKEGMAVTVRVLSTDAEKRTIRLTMKKSLVNSDVKPWSSYDDLSVGDESPATIVSLLRDGAVMQFYGDVRGFLPVSEMSESFIKDPSQHFHVGQVVEVHILSIDQVERRMRVSCKDATASSASSEAIDKLEIGQIVAGTVTGIHPDSAELLLDSGVRAVLKLQQFTDGSDKKNTSAMKKIRASQKLTDLVVLEKLSRQSHVVLSNKPSLIKAARSGTLVKSVSDLQVGNEVDGFIRGITASEVFVQFAGGLVGLLHRSQLPDEVIAVPAFGYHIGQSLTTKVLNVDEAKQRFNLTMRAQPESVAKSASVKEEAKVINAVDGKSRSMADFKLGSITKVRVRSVKSTQLNVSLADNVQGRIDISETFDRKADIKNMSQPLASQFKQGDVIEVKIIGLHDTRNHKFLPLSHRTGSNPVFELSAKRARIEKDSEDLLSMDNITVGATCLAFVNHHDDRSVFVHLSPNVRSRIDFLQLSTTVRDASEIQKVHPVGSALQVTVNAVDPSNQKVELSVKSGSTVPTRYSDVKEGMILPGRVTKTTDAFVTVQLSNSLVGRVPLMDIGDDYDEAKTSQFTKNELVRVCVTHVDAPNKKLLFSTRPSQILSSSLPIKDRHIGAVSDLKINDIVRGFVSNVADMGVFVRLGSDLTAFVKVANLTDAFVKDWKSQFTVDQLVRGRITEIDIATGKVSMSLKPSHVDKHYTAPLSWTDIQKGQIVTAKVRKVEDFGVFIVVDSSQNVSGLCHRSELADNKVEDVKKLYDVGDVVKAIVLKVEPEKRRAAFGLKASYFADQAGKDASDDDEDMEDGGVVLEGSEADSDEGESIDLENVRDLDEDESEDDEDALSDVMSVDGESIAKPKGLSAGPFDFSGNLPPDTITNGYASDNESVTAPKTKKRKKAAIQEDLTGDLDAHGPRSTADYERLLLGQPNSSTLWIQYMAFQLGLGEVEKAREIAERALNTIHIRESDEKRNVWVAWLNLEVAFGDDEGRLQQVFERACQYNDRGEMHERLAGIYIESGKTDAAATLFTSMTKIKSLTAQPSFWLNYATFLLTTLNDATSARQLLSRATQSVPANEQRQLTVRFGLLEFTSPNGDPERGRTVFEGLLSTWPKRWDLWDAFVDAESSLLAREKAAAAPATTPETGKKGKKRKSGDISTEAVDVGASSVENIRDLFGRMSRAKMRPRRAKYVFKRWMEFENKFGDAKGVKKVEGVAREWVEKHAEEKDDGEE